MSASKSAFSTRPFTSRKRSTSSFSRPATIKGECVHAINCVFGKSCFIRKENAMLGETAGSRPQSTPHCTYSETVRQNISVRPSTRSISIPTLCSSSNQIGPCQNRGCPFLSLRVSRCQLAIQARHRTWRPFPFKKGTAKVAFREIGDICGTFAVNVIL